MHFYPGDIYLAYGGGNKVRPILIVSRENLNRGNYVIAIPFTSANFRARSQLANCVAFNRSDFGLDEDCVAQAEAISIIVKEDILIDKGKIGAVSAEKMHEVVMAIGYVIEADCTPS